jgi:hypothetical protein
MSKLFRIGLSFPGDLRKDLVSEVAKILAFKFAKNYTQDGQDLVLYDHFHKDQFNLPELSKELPNLYRDQCEVIAVFLCSEYAKRHWCGLEWEKIKELAADPNSRRKIYLIWYGPEDDLILNELGLDRKVDGFREFDQPTTPYEVAEGIWRRLIKLPSDADFSDTPMADEIRPSIIKTQVASSRQTVIQRLAIVLLPSDYDDSNGYRESGRYEINIYIKDKDSESYEPFYDLNFQCPFIERTSIIRDWPSIAQVLAFWTSETTRGDSRVILDLFLPFELLHPLLSMDFLDVPCLVDHEELNCADEFVGYVKFASLCPVIIRPLDRYVRPSLRKHMDHLKNKYLMLSQGRGRWIHGEDAASSDSLIAKRDIPEDSAVRMVSDLPIESAGKEDWLKKLIGSMVPLALWWAAPGEMDREKHLLEYKCNERSMLEVGPKGVVAMEPSDLDLLPLERKRLSNRACSLVLMIDNPQLVPKIPKNLSNSSPSLPSYTIRSFA